MKTLLPVLVGVTLALASVAGNTEETDKDVLKLSIERKSLRDALNDWAQQTGYQLVAEIRGDYVAPRIDRRLTAQEALERLIKGTPLTYQWMGERLVAVREKSQLAPASLQTMQSEGGELSAVRVTKLSGDEWEGARLAANDPRVAQNDAGASPMRGGPNPEGDVEELEEIVVTGTHIRGATPVGAQLIVIDRKEIAASGHSRVQDLLEDLPQNFSGSASEDNFGTDFRAANWTKGSAIDLRGLGASSTLVLVNGRRQPAGGSEGAFVDISSIATSAVERIEVLPDGASALYGADAIGGVVNFVLRKDFEGMETAARFGTGDSAADELTASHIMGTVWNGGNVLAGYEYSHRDTLLARDTPYGIFGGDMRSLGGSDFRVPGGNPGVVLDPQTFAPGYAIPRGQDGRNLSVADLIPGQVNYWDTASRNSWLPEERHNSAFFAASQRIGSNAELSLNGRYSQRKTNTSTTETLIFALVPSSNPFYVNPYEDVLPGLVIVPYSFSPSELPPPQTATKTETYAFTLDASVGLAANWRLNFGASWGRERNQWSETTLNVDGLSAALADPDPSTSLNVFGDGANNNAAVLNSIRETELRRGTSTIRSADIIADGPLFELPAGLVRLAVGADYREETLDADRGAISGATGVFTRFPTIVGSMDRQVSSLFSELVLPIVPGIGTSSIPKVEVALAARFEDYSDFGSTVNPKIGLNVSPITGLTLRGSWGSSFRAPRLNELSSSANPPGAGPSPGFPDPRSPSGFSNVLVLTGSNADLKEETAEMWTAGFQYSPYQAPAVSIAATYFSLDYEDKILVGGDGQNTLIFEDQWSEIITRDPSQAEVDALCASPGFIGTCLPNVAAIIDQRLRNLGVVRVRGFDFALNYKSGIASFGISGTRTLTYDRAASSRAPLFEVLDTVNNPVSVRLRGTVGVDIQDWAANLAVNYVGGYDDPANSQDVDAWTTVNPSLSYRVNRSGWLMGTLFQLSVINLFDEKPSFVNSQVGFDTANMSQVGRSLALSINKEW